MSWKKKTNSPSPSGSSWAAPSSHSAHKPSRHLLPVAAGTGTGVVKFLRCISPMSVSVSFSNQLFYEMNILMELETNFYVANNFYEASQLPRFIRGLSNTTVKTDFSKRKTKLL